MSIPSAWGEHQRLRQKLSKILHDSVKREEITSDESLFILWIFDFASQIVTYTAEKLRL